MTDIPQHELQTVLNSLGNRPFSTYDVVISLQKLYPKTWKDLVKVYGEGGAGAGKFYSAYSRVAHALGKLSNAAGIARLDYRPAPDGYGNRVIRYWALATSKQEFPEEVSEPETVTEGAKKTIVVNRYERSSSARLTCIKKWGISCCVCGFNFEKVYGALGAGYIQVHHLVALHTIGSSYQLDPVKDLRPVCPNCHAMLHRNGDTMSVEALQNVMRSQSKPVD
jgi:hypothetical protein